MNKKQSHKFMGMPVDAGNITVIAREKIQAVSNNQLIKLEKPGKYHIKLEVDNCWQGNIKKEGMVTTKSGELVVGDACYTIIDQEIWGNFMTETNFLRTKKPWYLVADTGGDGCFDVTVTIEAIGGEK